MKIKSNKMARTSRCKVVREHYKLEDNSAKNTAFDEVVAKKEAIREGLKYKESLRIKGQPYGSKERELLQKSLQVFLAKRYNGIEFSNKLTRNLKYQDAVKQTFRYLNDEDRQLDECYPMTLEIDGVTVEDISPDRIYINRKAGIVEVIKYRCKKPDITQAGDAEDESALHCLDLYNMLQYAKKFAVKGQKTQIKASYYFLRKNTTFDNKSKGLFDEVFFNRDKNGKIAGGNVVSLEEEYFRPMHDDNCLFNDGERPCELGDGTVDKAMCPYMAVCAFPGSCGSKLDEHFAKEYATFVAGRDKEDCDPKKDCPYCQFNHLCNFTFPPEIIKEKKKRASLENLHLSKEQKEVTESDSGAVLVMAGAGAGKTMCVSVWFMTLLDNGVDPEKMLGISFTDASANELKERVIDYCEDAFVDVDTDKLNITTFNSFGNAVIAEHYEELGFENEPRVIQDVTRMRIIEDLITRDSSLAMLKDGLNYSEFDSKLSACVGALPMTSMIFKIIKANDFSLGQEKEVKMKLPWNYQMQITTPTIEKLFELYAEYDAILREKSYIEYADQLYLLFELLKINPTIFEELGLEYLLVDEFQDTSEGQIKVLKELMSCKSFKELLVVGDASQAIYSFRDTTPEFILNLEQHIGRPVKVIYLNENYRSTEQIIDAANKINANNGFTNIPPLIAKRGPGKPVVVRGFWDKDEEMEYIADKIQEKIAEGFMPESIAFIGRQDTYLQKMGSYLTERNIPWVLLNPERYMQNSRVLAAVDYSKFYQQPSSVVEARSYLNAILKNTLFSYTDDKINEMTEELQQETEKIRNIFSPADRREAFLDMLKAIDEEDEIFLKFLDTLNNFVSLDQILEYCQDLDKYGENEKQRRYSKYPGVVLTTAHSSKGLEWPVVFNSLNGYDSEETRKKESQIAESRRLMYVSMTRARDELYMTGQYVAYGNKRDGYIYNRYLQEAYAAAGFEFAPGEPPKKTRKKKEEDKPAAAGKSVRDLIRSKKTKGKSA